MPDNKKHHYVPKFYLREFSQNKGKINIFNIPSEKIITNGKLDSQCYKNYFYGKDLEVEKELSQIEGDASEIFKSIRDENKLPSRNSVYYNKLVHYIILQHNRTLYSNKSWKESLNNIKTYMLEKDVLPETKEETDKLFNEFEEGTTARIVNQSKLDYLLATTLTCKLLINTDIDYEFITSDNPVVFYNQYLEYRKHRGNSAITSKGIQIFYPIDSQRLLIFYDSSVYKVGNKKEFIIKISNLNDLTQLNILQVVNSLSNFYWSSEGFDIMSIYKLSLKYLRKHKSNFNSVEAKDNHLLMVSQEEVRVDLKLSFIKTLKKAKKDFELLEKREMQRPIVFRDEKMYEAYMRFVELFDDGVYSNADEFWEFYKLSQNKN